MDEQMDLKQVACRVASGALIKTSGPFCVHELRKWTVPSNGIPKTKQKKKLVYDILTSPQREPLRHQIQHSSNNHKCPSEESGYYQARIHSAKLSCLNKAAIRQLDWCNIVREKCVPNRCMLHSAPFISIILIYGSQFQNLQETQPFPRYFFFALSTAACNSFVYTPLLWTRFVISPAANAE